MTPTNKLAPDTSRAVAAGACALTLLSLMHQIHRTSTDPAAVALAAIGIEYASGESDPDCYPDDGYSVDAAGTFGG